MSKTTYEARGAVRGNCGHAHRSEDAALACIERDRKRCAALGGGAYSDRVVVTTRPPRRRESLARCLRLLRSGERRGIAWLHGCPVGGWGETQQARSQMCEELPHRSERSYTIDDVISALYTVDSADRYRCREVTP